MKKQIAYYDVDGNLLKKEEKGKGRPPKNSYLRDNTYIIENCSQNADGSINTSNDTSNNYQNGVKPHYLDVDPNTHKILKDHGPKGRGRPNQNYEKKETGEFSGHWIRYIHTPETVIESGDDRSYTSVVAESDELSPESVSPNSDKDTIQDDGVSSVEEEAISDMASALGDDEEEESSDIF